MYMYVYMYVHMYLHMYVHACIIVFFCSVLTVVCNHCYQWALSVRGIFYPCQHVVCGVVMVWYSQSDMHVSL